MLDPMSREEMLKSEDCWRYARAIARNLIARRLSGFDHGMCPEDVAQRAMFGISRSESKRLQTWIERPRGLIAQAVVWVVENVARHCESRAKILYAEVDINSFPAEVPETREWESEEILNRVRAGYPKLATVAERAYLRGESKAEIAEALRMPQGTVRAYLLRFREHARWLIAQDRASGLQGVTELPQFIDHVTLLPYTYGAARALDTVVDACTDEESRRRIVELAAVATVEMWGTNPKAASTLATMLSTQRKWLKLDNPILKELLRLGEGEIRSGNFGRISIAEPLVFALSDFPGMDGPSRLLLDRRIRDEDCIEADAKREKQYYGTVKKELRSILHHTFDTKRSLLQQVNDAGRLLYISRLEDYRPGSPGRTPLLPLLAHHAKLLKELKEEELAQMMHAALSEKGVRKPRGR